MKPLRANAGSALTLVIVFIFVLMVMGIALASATAAHLRLQKGQEDRKAAFYSAESGIDGVIAQLTLKAKEIHSETVAAVTNNLNLLIDQQSTIFEANLYYSHAVEAGIIPSAAPAPTLNPWLFKDSINGTVNQTEVQRYVRYEYDRIFKEEFLNWVISDFDIIQDSSVFNDRGYTGDIPSIGLIAAALEDIEFTDSELVLQVFSFYHPRTAGTNGGEVSHKLVTADITITVPGYEAVVLDQNVMKFDPNILWTKALTSDKNIIVESGNVNIYGNTYAFGSNTLTGALRGKSGILIGSDSAVSVNIYGESVTDGDIRFITDGSTLEVNGNLYAANVLIDEGSRNMELNVNNDRRAFTAFSIDQTGTVLPNPFSSAGVGDLIIKNNLELRAVESQVNIGGSFIGFSNPVDMFPVNKTSCIIVDIRDALGRPNLAASNSSLSINNFTVICGIAYLSSDASPGEYFNTGESIALSGNYHVYKNFLEDLINAENNFLSQFKSGYMASHSIGDSGYNPSLTDITYYNPFGFGLFAPNRYLGLRFNIINYADYLYLITRMVVESSANEKREFAIIDNITLDGGVVNIDESKYYSHGTVFANNNVYPRRSDESNLSRYQRQATKMYYGQVAAYGDLSDDDFIVSEVNYSNGFIQKIENQFAFNGYCDVLVNNDINERVIVRNGSITLAGQTGTLKGVIIASGDVILDGTVIPLDFRGTIIAGGNIIIRGNVTITNDRDFIAKAMFYYGGTFLRGFTKKTEVRPTYSFKTFAGDTGAITRDDFAYTLIENDESRNGQTGAVNKSDTVKDLVKATNWQLIEY